MTKYNVWVGGENSWNRSYLGEVGFQPLTEEQIERWCSEEDVDTEMLSERLHRDWDQESEGEDDFPSRDEVENGCLGFGAYTDQTFGVSKQLEDGEEEIVWSGNYNELCLSEDEDEGEICPRYVIESSSPGFRLEEGEFLEETGVAYHYSFKGGWGMEIELPDEEEFDVRKLQFSILDAEGLGEIVTSVSYNGEDYYDENDSDGKSCEWYLVKNGELYSL